MRRCACLPTPTYDPFVGMCVGIIVPSIDYSCAYDLMFLVCNCKFCIHHIWRANFKCLMHHNWRASFIWCIWSVISVFECTMFDEKMFKFQRFCSAQCHGSNASDVTRNFFLFTVPYSTQNRNLIIKLIFTAEVGDFEEKTHGMSRTCLCYKIQFATLPDDFSDRVAELHQLHM